MGRIVVPTAGRDTAVLALRLDGSDPLAVEMEDEYAYSRLLTDCWNTGESFVVVEHDVVPWPGSMEKLLDCPEPWCGHFYPFAPGTIRGALGCVKFSGQLTRAYPDLYNRWVATPWNQMDGAVYSAMNEIGLLKKPDCFHRHMPDFAHVK